VGKNRRKALAKKFPEMDKRFQEIMDEVGEPRLEHLEDSGKGQKGQDQS
jgi:hypothetical protein